MNTRQVASEYRLAQWVQAIQERIANGEKVKDFCVRKGISRNTYFYWQQRIRKTACEKIAEIQRMNTQTGLAVPGFTEIKLAELPTTGQAGQIRIEVKGVQITADSEYPTEALTVLLRELTRPC